MHLPCANYRYKRTLRYVLGLSALHLPIQNRESLYISIAEWVVLQSHSTNMGKKDDEYTHKVAYSHNCIKKARARTHTHTPKSVKQRFCAEHVKGLPLLTFPYSSIAN